MLDKSAQPQFDLMTAEFSADPYPLMRRMRAEAPVYFCEPMGSYFITRYADVMAALREERLSADRLGVVVSQLPPDVKARLQPVLDHFAQWSLFMDPPGHTKIRALIGKAFGPKVSEGMRPRIRAVVDELLSQHEGAGRMDLVRDFAAPLPAIVIAEMLGVPSKDRELFERWAMDIFAFFGSMTLALEVGLKALQALEEMRAYVREVAAERRASPKDDLLSAFVSVEEQGATLTAAQILATCSMLLFAGHETTKNLITNAVHVLLRHPEELAKLRADPALLPGAIDEVLRFEAPVKGVVRTATDDVEIGGVKIARGQWVYASIGAANRDPSLFEEPDRFRIDRKDNKHIAFGHGIHFCAGAALSRIEGQIAVEEVLRRMPKLAVEGAAPEWEVNVGFRALKSLPVRF